MTAAPTAPSIDSLLEEKRRFAPPPGFAEQARVGLFEEYQKLYREGLADPDGFWRREARDLTFRKPWTKTFEWQAPHARWFLGAELNVSESCLDRHLAGGPGSRKNKAALVWEAETGETHTLTYAQLHREVCAF